MKNPVASQPFLQAYSASFRLHAHLLLAWGYEQAKLQFNTEDEEEITDILYQSIHHLLLVEEEGWMSKYAVKNEDPISGGKHKGKSRREIDLVIELTGPSRPQYIFEAKMLNWRKIHQRTDNYINKSGMGRFMEGEYADYTARFPEVAMVGYIVSDSIEEWHNRLKTTIEEKQEQLRLHRPQANIAICDTFTHEWMSEHKRDTSDSPIVIYHILLDCSSK